MNLMCCMIYKLMFSGAEQELTHFHADKLLRESLFFFCKPQNTFITFTVVEQYFPQEAEEVRGVSSQSAPVSETGEPHLFHHIYFCLCAGRLYSSALPSHQKCA